MTGTLNLLRRPGRLPVSGTDALLTLQDVWLTRGSKRILANVNLTVNRGDFMAITGPNGGGKTTLIRLILNLLKPSAGRVVYANRNMLTGYLPQKNSIDSSYPITVREVIASGLLALPLSRKERAERVRETLELVELEAHAGKPIGALSGGQQQRALLGRAIISRPEMLVLDEPLSYIDKHFEKKIYNIIEHLSESATMLLVSHEITTVAAMANRHIIVNGGITECQSAHHFAKIALCD